MAIKRKLIPKAERKKVIARDKIRCVQCGKSMSLHINKIGRITIRGGAFHHIIPLVYGGLNRALNICILCNSCHMLVHSGPESAQKYVEMFEAFVLTGRLT